MCILYQYNSSPAYKDRSMGVSQRLFVFKYARSTLDNRHGCIAPEYFWEGYQHRMHPFEPFDKVKLININHLLHVPDPDLKFTL